MVDTNLKKKNISWQNNQMQMSVPIAKVLLEHSVYSRFPYCA